MTHTPSPPILGIVFDIDGVIFDSRHANIGYYNSILENVGLPPMSNEDEEYCHMASWQQSFARIIPAELQEKALEARGAFHYRDFILPKLSLETGLLEALTWLNDLDARLGICTNRFDGVEDLLRYFGLDTFFSTLKTARNCRPKPDPQGLQEILEEWHIPSHTLAFIGDTKADELAARAAGVHFWAFRNPDLNADMHLTDFFSFMDAVRPLVERE